MGAASHAAYLARGDLVHPKLKGFGGRQVALDLLEAHINGDHEKVGVLPDLVLEQLMKVFLPPKPGKHVDEHQRLDM